jgi:aminopeptidase N
MGENVLVYLAPKLLAEQATLDALDGWLGGEGKEADAPTRRYVGEARADVVRALAAQTMDAEHLSA